MAKGVHVLLTRLIMSRHIDCPDKMQEIRDWSFDSYLEPMVVLCSSICFTFSDLCPSVVLDERSSVQNWFTSRDTSLTTF
jgi:hypothetical protein